jgi:hypothetical protein
MWLTRNRRDLMPSLTPSQQFVFDQGEEVGKLAQQLYPGGVDARPASPTNYQPALELTQQLIAEGRQVIYEAAFQFDGVLSALDILVKIEDGYYGYEIKSTTSIHDINITDAAMQYWVMKHCGVELKDISIIHINKEYERDGEIELQKLFKTESVYYLVLALQDEIAESVHALKKETTSSTCPEIRIGKQCTEPYTCVFKDYCWKDIPDASILDFRGFGKEERFEQYHKGVKLISDVKDWQQLKPPYNYVVESHINKGVYLDTPPLKKFMDGMVYPLHFLDFETVRFAIPKYQNTYSYQQIPFQYSLHTIERQNSEVLSSAFLAEPSKDFREDFLVSLLKDLGTEGTILVWNIGFERSKMYDLSFLFPQYQSQIKAVIERMIDLAIPFQKRWFYHHLFSCSFSIKQVLPVIAPDLCYKNLTVNNGDDASVLFMKMMIEPNKDWTTERKHLLDYCALDTYAMVRIVQFLLTLV